MVEYERLDVLSSWRELGQLPAMNEICYYYFISKSFYLSKFILSLILILVRNLVIGGYSCGPGHWTVLICKIMPFYSYMNQTHKMIHGQLTNVERKTQAHKFSNKKVFISSHITNHLSDIKNLRVKCLEEQINKC